MSIEDREDEDGEAGINPQRIISAVRRRWRIAAGIACSTTLIALTIALLIPNRYEASTTIQLDPRKKNVANLEGVVSDLNVDTAAIESEAEVIRSRQILLKVIDRLDLRNDPEFHRAGFIERLVLPLSSSETKTGIGEHATEAADPVVPRRDEFASATLCCSKFNSPQPTPTRQL